MILNYLYWRVIILTYYTIYKLLTLYTIEPHNLVMQCLDTGW